MTRLRHLRPYLPGPAIDRALNRGLPPDRRIILRVRWPFYLAPVLLVLHLLSPSPVMMAFIVTLLGIYAAGLAWVRHQVLSIGLERKRRGVMLVAGDSLREEFILYNESALPLLWLEFDDNSFLPGYHPGQVVTCGAHNRYTWRAEAVCGRRGVFRLGPHTLRTGDPFGLFTVEITDDRSDALLVYPRVAQLPGLELPRGAATGRDPRRRPLHGDTRAPMVRNYLPGDSLRYVHWPSTAHRGDLMVTELDVEPSGDLWIVLDLNAAVQQGEGEHSTLEYGIVAAASLAAELLTGHERRAVGLLAAPGDGVPNTILLPPLPGRGRLWEVLAALAPVTPGDVPLSDLLDRARDVLGQGQTVVVITPDIRAGAADWVAQLLHLRRAGIASSALVIEPPLEESEAPAAPDGTPPASDGIGPLVELLARQEITAHFLRAGEPLRPVLTYRRRRTVLRTTPHGGVVSYEVEEEVG
ncbi:MAG: DUF58 domain-containing protein [Caldilineae bacterium]|nr:MAG: DUF58 domain-containing protein [Caldilineae bacterium]